MGTKTERVKGTKKMVPVIDESLKMKLVYDVKSVPGGLGIANMIKIFEQHRVVFWDSDNGVKPAFFALEGVPADLLIVDTTGKQIDFEQYEREFNTKVFWDKEIYNCKHSPIYYWNNYGTPIYPSTVEGTRKYLSSLGMKDLPVMDSAKAKKAWDKQKEVVSKAMKFITLEHLEERKGVIDLLKAEYKQKVLGLEHLVKGEVDLFNAKGEPHEYKKRISNLVGKIKTFSPVPERWKEYRNKKRRWDGAMLYNTNYDILLEIYYAIRQGTNKSKVVTMVSKSK